MSRSSGKKTEIHEGNYCQDDYSTASEDDQETIMELAQATFNKKNKEDITAKDCCGIRDMINYRPIPKKKAMYIKSQCYNFETLKDWLDKKEILPHTNNRFTKEDFNEAIKAGKIGLIKTLREHERSIFDVAWSPDSKKLVSASADSTVIIWDVTNSRLLKTLKGHTGTVICVSWSPDSSKIISGGEDKIINIWDANTGSCLKTLKDAHTTWIQSIEWNPKTDRKEFVSCSSDKTLKIWDADRGKCIKTLKGHTDSVYSVSWSPDGTKIASGSVDETIKIWNADTGKCIKTLNTPHVFTVAWSPDGMKIASGNYDKIVQIWNADTGEKLKNLEGHTSHLRRISWSPDSLKIVSGSRDQTVRIWNADTGENLETLNVAEGEVLAYINGIAWSPDGSKIAGGNMNNLIYIWDVSNLQQIEGGSTKKKAEKHVYKGKSYTVRVGSKGGKYILVGKDKKKVYI